MSSRHQQGGTCRERRLQARLDELERSTRWEVVATRRRDDCATPECYDGARPDYVARGRDGEELLGVVSRAGDRSAATEERHETLREHVSCAPLREVEVVLYGAGEQETDDFLAWL
ncbi:hypothetical protein [Halospeciosus flavus]|uniref:Uncharacterized protein n=1 Tax=Halospeciosus flavus TaxID=3032283 RepID=A0ABD5Z1G7_9EURY|nr:hypothetical protein [Halospeciosus flavus]